MQSTTAPKKKGRRKAKPLPTHIAFPNANSDAGARRVTIHSASTNALPVKRTELYLPDRLSPTKRQKVDGAQSNLVSGDAENTDGSTKQKSVADDKQSKGSKSEGTSKNHDGSDNAVFDGVRQHITPPGRVGRNHVSCPFHFPEKWNGTNFERTSQAAIGRVIHLGHGGDRCPSARDSTEPLMLDVVEINGVHGCRVLYCDCKGAGHHWEQLLDVELFPATLSKTATAFSFKVLKQFDLLSSIAKLTAMDFVTSYRRMTNNAFPQDVPDFYKSFRRVMRVWRSLQIRKRVANSMPGFNMPLRWRVEPSPEDRHKFTLFLSIDGNFKQQLKIKNCDQKDIELFVAFFSRKEVFDAYYKTCSNNVEKSTCANLKANNLQSQLKFISMVISGVISCKCARHDLYRPGATVDLKKGESFAYTDFALRQALKGFENYTDIVLSYDIACQYSKKALARFNTHFPDCKVAMENIRYHVPKLHGHGHSEDCRYQFSFDYADNVGRTHGERIESGWAEGNLAGPSTREMNPGHRHETLSIIYNEWNYQQIIKLAAFLAKKLVEARKQSAIKAAHFEKLTSTMGGDRIKIWNSLDTSPTVRNGEVLTVYRVKNVKIPSMKTIEDRLANEEANVLAASAHSKPAQFIATGLKLEARQYALKTKARSDDASLQRVAAEISAERLKLKDDIFLWREDQMLYMPEVRGYVSSSPLVEDEHLFLPSALSQKRRETQWYAQLSAFETSLRKGQADDALINLRLALRYKDSLNRGRRRVAYGNRNSTRAAVLIRRVADLVNTRAAAYRHARRALISLGVPANDPSYPELKKEDIRLKRVFAAKELGEGKFTGSWIWANGPRGVLSDAEDDGWEEEGNKVEWFRARIDAKQWREEVEILDEELGRTAAYFTKMSELWSTLAEQSTLCGSSEYAYQKANMFSRRAKDAKDWHTWALSADKEQAEK
ncbi:hypothetical protein SCHPADRAFT_941460 [Schizopora paradoxa]|uniref:CxC2-like cysteine cluster KDZ transposase-associated domain-containing protein n=1 Tax=Schizopora paradoxa TaxID=27342 RepID=A0A0H2RJT1_9AGAM|nr:hypothetical protein SCHPADRAFT_941460 [Schizopora paradoxa]